MLLASTFDRSAPVHFEERTSEGWPEYLADQVATHPLFRRRQISLLGSKGQVVLTGTVGSYYEKQLAQEVVRRCDGVNHIENRLEVDYRA